MCALAECSALGLTRLQLKHQPGSILIWRLDWMQVCLLVNSLHFWLDTTDFFEFLFSLSEGKA